MMDRAKRFQQEISKIFKVQVRVYLDQKPHGNDMWWYYTYKLKVNGIYIKAQIPCDDLQTKADKVVLRMILEQIFSEIRFFYT